VLISDGQETCGGDPCQVVRDLETAGIRFSLHVIGLNVDDSTRAQLTCIAQAGGGVYQDANTSQELQTALEVVQQQVIQPQPTPAVEPPTEPPPIPAPPSTPVPIPATPSVPVPPSTNNGLFEGQIAYTGIDNNIYVMRGNSPTPIQVTFNGNTDNLYYAPAWSPDGKQLAYLLTHSNNNDGLTPKTLYISNFDNNQHAVYLENVGFGFDWSPEGNIIFDRAADYSKVMDPQDIPDQASGIWKLDIASGATVEIIPRLADQNPLANPDYSPNGNWILFSQLMWESALLNIYAVSNGAVFPINDYFPCKGNWSPDGNNLVFISLPIGRYEIILKTYSPYEGKIRDIYQNNIMEGGNMERAFWSADGKHIIFGTPDGVMQVNPDGSSPLLLTDLGYPLDASFQSNQVLIANKDNHSELMIYDITTLAFTHVTASYQNCDIFGNTYVSIGCGQNVDWGPLP
jgi:Tol biopolymer transport system component